MARAGPNFVPTFTDVFPWIHFHIRSGARTAGNVEAHMPGKTGNGIHATK